MKGLQFNTVQLGRTRHSACCLQCLTRPEHSPRPNRLSKPAKNPPTFGQKPSLFGGRAEKNIWGNFSETFPICFLAGRSSRGENVTRLCEGSYRK
jgi:hypothetical protein